MSTALAISDMSLIATSLDTLRISWDGLQGGLQNVVKDTEKAKTSQEVIVGQAWYLAACNEWNVVIDQSNNLNDRTITTSRVTIG